MCMLTAVYPTKQLQVWEQKMTALFISNLLLTNSKNNRDGLGFGSKIGYTKWECPASKAIFGDEYNSTLTQLIGTPFIAHVRAISTGVNAKQGAHPFMVGSVLLAHNGTFSNYRQYLKKYEKLIDDPNPVDSHVITYMLAEEVGSGMINHGNIESTLKKTKGSYALLLVNTKNGEVWVVPGGNTLYCQKTGPLWVVNTSKYNLESTSEMIAGTSKLLFEREWVTEDAIKVAEYTTNVLTKNGLVKQGELERPKLANTTTYHYYRGGLGNPDAQSAHAGHSEKKISTKKALAKAKITNEILNLEYVSRTELILGCFLLLESDWWKLDVDDLEVLHDTFKNICELYGSAAKAEVWKQIMEMTNQNGYAVIAAYTNIQFPYIMNELEDLYGFAAELEKDIIEGNSIPFEEDKVNAVVSNVS